MSAITSNPSLVRSFISNSTDKYCLDNPMIENIKHVFEVSNNVALDYNSNPGGIIDKSEYYTYALNSDAKAVTDI